MRALLLACALAGAAGCAGKTFRFSQTDNDRGELAAALAHRELPAAPAPINAAHDPRAFVAVGGPHPAIVAFDLATAKPLWRQPAQLQSRIAVGGAFVVALESHALVARAQATGAPLWHAPVDGAFVGVAADRDRVYLVSASGGNGQLTALDGATGKPLWHAAADGTLGAPAANGVVVYVPYYSQWLAILDGATGAQLARVRGLDGQIPMLFATSREAYYGSPQGVFRLDEQSAAGTRTGATYRTATIPRELEHTLYGPDAYDPVQATYSADDRARVLWSGVLGDAGYAVHYFRFVFGFDPQGALVWAYSHPRTELVASADTGPAIVAVSQSGDVVALDARTGELRLDAKLGTTDPVVGATFDADGWAPTATPPAGAPTAVHAPSTTGALVEIVRDRDARFDRVKELALRALADQPGGEVTKALLGVLADPRQPGRLADDVVALLAARKDPTSLPALTAQLQPHVDYIAKSSPLALGAVAKAIAALGDVAVDPAAAQAAQAALEAQLDDPATPPDDLASIIGALAAIGHGNERAALSAHLLLYHCDAELGADPLWTKAIAAGVARHAGPAERALLHAVAADPRTPSPLADAVREALTAD